MRAELSAFRDGVYSFEDYMEDDGIEDKPYKIHVDVHVQGDEVVVDYGGTDSQARGPINAVLSVAWSSAYNAILHLTDPSIPKNSGCFRPIKIVAPGGSLVNADYPATCVGGNTETHIRIAYTIIAGALAMCAGSGLRHRRRHPQQLPLRRNGSALGATTWSATTSPAPPGAGRSFADGNEVINCINGNSRMVPIEVFEVRYPWMIEEYALQPDTAGPGRFRGAHALAKVLRCMDTEITVSSVSDRHKMRPWGLLGGGPGATGGLFYRAAGSDDWQPFTEAFGKTSPSKFANVTICPGDRVRLIAPGAGGYGDVAERDPAHDRGRPERRLDHAGRRAARLRLRLASTRRCRWSSYPD